MQRSTPATDGDCLLQAILHAPGDDAPRLQYADWLDENPTAECPECVGGIRRAPGQIKCFGCSGSGRVPSGNAERAEFIRVQCEIDRPPKPNDSGHPARFVWLKERERKLLDRHESGIALWSGWGLPKHSEGYFRLDYGDQQNQQGVGIRFRRGFVAHVSCTLAAFVGGPCERCGRESPETRRAEDTWRGKCNACHGTGTRPGLVAALFAAHPIMSVRLTDRVPLRFENRYLWHNADHRFNAQDGCQRPADHLPSELFTPLSGHIPRPSGVTAAVRGFSTADAARAALSDACVAYGRGLAGLPSLQLLPE